VNGSTHKVARQTVYSDLTVNTITLRQICKKYLCLRGLLNADVSSVNRTKDELQMLRKQADLTKFKVPSLQMPTGTEENQGKICYGMRYSGGYLNHNFCDMKHEFQHPAATFRVRYTVISEMKLISC
jgi:hypothetical protein